MNVQPELTYDYFVTELEGRIVRLERNLANSKEALATIKAHPEIVPIMARLIRPEYGEI